MSNFVIVSSNNVVKGDDVELRLTISQNVKPFDLEGKIKVYKVFEVVNESDASVALKKYPGGTSDFKYNSDLKYHSFSLYDNLSSFEIIIKGTRNKDFESSAALKIDIPTGTDSVETIDFEVVKDDKPLIINAFKANNYIIQEGKHTLELSYTTEDKEAELTLFENNEVWKGDVSKQPIIIGFSDRNKPSGLYEYTLQAKKGNQTVCKKLNIVYVKKTTVETRVVPNNKTIINFCTAQNGDYLYTLMFSKTEDIFEIHFTDQIDGKNTWARIQITDQKMMKLFATSPMLHLQSDNEKENNKLGRILFIGGSRIGKIPEAEDIADKVAVITLDDENNNIKVSKPKNFFPKFGHTCILFPKGDNPNTIWLMGGQDEYGASTNDILTSSDGVTWTLQTETSPWSARVMLSASVSWQYAGKERKKDALWLSGGFKNFAGFGGGFQDDVWKFDKNVWKKIAFEQNIIDKDSLACAIAYGSGGVEETGHTGLFVFGNRTGQGKNTYFLNLNKNNDDKYVLKNNVPPELSITHFNQGCYITAFFRECMWVMGLYDTGLKGITYSGLWYRIPTIHEETINFYNDK
jgi:hypothetical protein